MVFQWQLWAFIGNNYEFLMAIMGLTLFLCIYQDFIYFFTIDPLGSKLTCYLSLIMLYQYNYNWTLPTIIELLFQLDFVLTKWPL